MLYINIIDQAFAHCAYSNNPLPPIQSSKHINWNRNIDYNKSTIIATEYDIKSDNFINFKGRKIAWLLECDKINNKLYEWVRENYKLYDKIFTHNKDFIKEIPNSCWVPFGGCWIKEEDWKLYDKEDRVSIVASSKSYLQGHRLRHQVISSVSGVDLYGYGYNPIDNKISSLSHYKYQIVIENEKIPGYFTEKIIDCFVTGTIPIYWGDPNISDVFDINGIITFNDIDELLKILNNIKDIEIDEKYINANFEKSKDFILAEDYIYKNYKELL